MFATYEEAVDFILNIPKFTTKNELGTTREFLTRIGDVTSTIPSIHVAGTNGKGSVSAFLRAGLNGAGYSVGMFTSPHLVDMRERFCIDGKMISKQEFLHVANFVYDEVMAMRETSGHREYHPTFFEYLFFMAVVWFKSKRPDFIVFETGLGGRLDATNTIASPAVCIITEIGLDHMEYLGDTVELIAGEKAGIIKPSVPVVYADRGESVSKVIKDRAEKLLSPSYGVTYQNIKILERTPERIDFSMLSRYDVSVEFSLNTRALYQVENAALAYEGILFIKDFCDVNIDLNLVRRGFGDMQWPGRMERIKDNLIVDGAHNEDGIRAFIESVSHDGFATRSLVYSAVSDKQIEKVCGIISDSHCFDKIYICHLESQRAADLGRIEASFGNVSVIRAVSVKEALNLMLTDDSEVKYVAGSLYLVGEVKALLEV